MAVEGDGSGIPDCTKCMWLVLMGTLQTAKTKKANSASKQKVEVRPMDLTLIWNI